jgi:hypothetical protein
MHLALPTMDWHRPMVPVLHLWSCLLVLAASGDDFNLARVVLPSAFISSEAELSLDDPINDFTVLAHSRDMQCCQARSRDGLDCLSPHLGILYARLASLSPVPGGRLAGNRSLPLSVLNTPLLC